MTDVQSQLPRFRKLACTLMIGKRRCRHTSSLTRVSGHGCCGRVGFNRGSALAANGKDVNTVEVTHFAAAARVLGWVRVTHKDKIEGLDISQHGEEGYIFQ